MALAHGLNLPGSERQRDILRALLLCEGATPGSTAALLHLEEEVIALFETLFWSTLGRERAYLARLCRPAKAAQTAAASDPGLRLRRIAFDIGSPQAVLAAAEVSLLTNSIQIQQLLQRGKSERLASAVAGLAMGLGSDAEARDLKVALGIAGAKMKQKADQPEIQVPLMSMGAAAMMELEKIRRTGAQVPRMTPEEEEEVRAMMREAKNRSPPSA